MSAQHTPGGQCEECEGFCLVPGPVIALPLVATPWACHAATTIKDADGLVLAECSGHGRHTTKDERIAAEIVRRFNAHNDLLLACQGLIEILETGVMSLGAVRAARAAVVKASGSAS